MRRAASGPVQVARGSPSMRAVRRRVRSTIVAVSANSWTAWAPPPVTPRPSSVGMPMAAVRLPSLPPPTATPTGDRHADARGDLLGQGVEVGRRRLLHRRPVEAAGHLQPGLRVHRHERRHRRLTRSASASSVTRMSTCDPGLGRHDVVGGPGAGDRRRHGRAQLGPAELVDREHLVGGLDERVDALLRLQPGVRRPAVDDDLEVAGALAADLDRPAVGRRLEHQHRRRTPGPAPRSARATPASRPPRRPSRAARRRSGRRARRWRGRRGRCHPSCRTRPGR